MTVSRGPLDGVIVLDLTQILAGPYCTQLLADAGATVIKVEPPGGDFSRVRGPKRTDVEGRHISAFSAAVNRGKQSICLDLKTSEGLRLARELAGEADVIVENFLPGTLTRLGLDLKALRAERPELVTCSISLFGDPERAGDLAKRGGLSMVAEAESTILGMQRRPDGSPTELGFALGDITAAMVAYGAIVTALLGRERSRQGQHLDISMVSVLLALNAPAVCAEEITRGQPAEAHEMMRNTAGMGLFPARDGYIAIGVNNDRLFVRLARGMGMDHLAEDPRYSHFTERDQRADEIAEIIATWSRERTTADIVAALSAEGVPYGLVASPSDVLDSAVVEQLGLLTSVEDGLGGFIRAPANPHGFELPYPAVPLFDEHRAGILQEILGVGAAEQENLRRAGAFGVPADGAGGHHDRRTV